MSWAIDPQFGEPKTWDFHLQWSRSGGGWITVASGTDVNSLTDTKRRLYSELFRGFYRVILEDSDGVYYPSDPTNFPSSWSVHDVRICTEIRRREALRNGEAGMTCWVLFRRYWGTPCTSCIDQTTKEVRNPRCSICFGTGFVGGYYAPARATCTLEQSDETVQEQLGTTVASVAMVRIAPIPEIAEHDIVIIDGSDRRYDVSKVTSVAQIRGRPIVQHLTLRALDPSNAVYDMQWDGTNDPENGESAIW